MSTFALSRIHSFLPFPSQSSGFQSREEKEGGNVKVRLGRFRTRKRSFLVSERQVRNAFLEEGVLSPSSGGEQILARSP